MQILIIDDVHPLLLDGLINEKHEVNYIPHATKKEIESCIYKYHGIIVRSKIDINADFITKATNLKWIARAGSGMDNVDVAFANSKNITCINASEANAKAVGEHTLGMLLALMHKLSKADTEVRNKIWDREGNRGTEISGKTIGIIGFGHTGKAVAQMLSGFNCKLLVYDKYLKNYSTSYAQESNMQTIHEQADIISFHIPLTSETNGIINEVFIEKFSKPFYLLNLSRGKILLTKDVIKFLHSGKILGVALDVLENEKINELNEEEKKCFEYLIHSKLTLLAPHVGGWSNESYKRISETLLLKIKQL